ncbi:MmgE/PrpD family protein [Celeribacter litoreus]|uniref:MmgE/PrpD family protein n=1 Tax=Celeribacter litoreus TaxID=2876714 RepID=UPI001CCC2909|nr:MmgE/PrpD family protein [Celeribacter litoreus]MCA0042516.1 MmgE/PrpD family protein [Celeribacter litoreus]
MTINTSEQSLTEGLFDLLQRDIPEATLQRAPLHLLDWIGCAIGGSVTPVGRKLTTVGPVYGTGGCIVIGHNAGLSADGAAFINGGLGNILEMDDIHRSSILHPGPIVIPAALAAAEIHHLSPKFLLESIICGYETTIRIGRSAGPAHYRHFHATATCGTFGAASGVARALGLEKERFVWALGNAGGTAGGVWRCIHEQVMTKQWHNALAASSGLRAATLADGGFSGSTFVLEGTDGFFEALAPDADPDYVLADPDAEWLIHETSFKPWPSCRHTHPALDAVRMAREEGIRSENVRSIDLKVYRDATRFCNRPQPKTENDAKFSLQHTAAVALLREQPEMEDFAIESFADRALTDLRGRVTVTEDPAITAAYPDHYGASATLTLTDGSTREFAVADAWGDPERPLDQDGIIRKFCMLGDYAGVSDQALSRIIDATLSLPWARGLADLNATFAEI